MIKLMIKIILSWWPVDLVGPFQLFGRPPALYCFQPGVQVVIIDDDDDDDDDDDGDDDKKEDDDENFEAEVIIFVQAWDHRHILKSM